MKPSKELLDQNAALKKELGFYKGIVDNVPVSIFINDVSSDDRYKMLWSNKYHKEIVGENFKQRNNVDKYYEKHYGEESKKAIYEAVNNFKRSKKPFALLYKYFMADNNYRWLYSIGGEFNDPALGGEQMLCIAVDLTDKVINPEKYEEMQQELRCLKHQLALAKLSKTETAILKLLAEGKSEADIANRRHNSLFTIKKHFQNIRKKLNIKKNTQLVRFAVETGIA